MKLTRFLLGLGLLLSGACSPAPDKHEPASPPSTHAAPVPRTEPLKPGDPLPKYLVEGWLNGAPPAEPAPLLVLDVWAAWCPYCRESAPSLVRLREKFPHVRFISVTNMSREAAELFANQFKITWPNGYGLSTESISALGAASGMSGPAGYEIAPVLYIVSREHRIIRADQQGRFKHQKPEEWERDMEAAIRTALQTGM